MWYLAACDDDGKCFGFLRKDKTVSKDPDNEVDKLMTFKKKADTNEICMQINLSRMLMPNGFTFRVAPVKAQK